jgi:hypothetical protein
MRRKVNPETVVMNSLINQTKDRYIREKQETVKAYPHRLWLYWHKIGCADLLPKT